MLRINQCVLGCIIVLMGALCIMCNTSTKGPSDGELDSSDTNDTATEIELDTNTSIGQTTDTDSATMTPTDTDSMPFDGTESDTASETGTASDTASETGTASDTASETGTASDTASETGTASDTASETGTESDTASETGTESDSGYDTDTVADTETDSGSSSDPCAVTAMPEDGEKLTGNSDGTVGNLKWIFWSNTPGSNSITVFDRPAFNMSWNQSGDCLVHMGLEWGASAYQPFTAYSEISADFSYTRSGTAGGFSYIGAYGWTDNPCVEWYIVDDSIQSMPFVPWQSTDMGEAQIDGETYGLYRTDTSGTGGLRCSGVNNSWNQYFSVRKTARQCGTISVLEHFKAWEAAGMETGGLIEAKVLIEVGGGTGTADFTVANVTAVEK